jgi:hypothetical protein
VLLLATAYVISEAFGTPKGVNLDFRRAPIFFALVTALICLGAGVTLLPDVPIIPLLLWVQVLNAMLLPLILVFILRLGNDPRLTGDLKNTRVSTLLGWGTTESIPRNLSALDQRRADPAHHYLWHNKTSGRELSKKRSLFAIPPTPCEIPCRSAMQSDERSNCSAPILRDMPVVVRGSQNEWVSQDKRRLPSNPLPWQQSHPAGRQPPLGQRPDRLALTVAVNKRSHSRQNSSRVGNLYRTLTWRGSRVHRHDGPSFMTIVG